MSGCRFFPQRRDFYLRMKISLLYSSVVFALRRRRRRRSWLLLLLSSSV